MLLLLNGLLGAICGIWFRVQILLPLIAFAGVEVWVVKHTGTWWSIFWHAVMLVVAIEIGYLAGASVVALRLSSDRRAISSDLAGFQHNKLWSR
jgi:hypothetical protein